MRRANGTATMATSEAPLQLFAIRDGLGFNPNCTSITAPPGPPWVGFRIQAPLIDCFPKPQRIPEFQIRLLTHTPAMPDLQPAFAEWWVGGRRVFELGGISGVSIRCRFVDPLCQSTSVCCFEQVSHLHFWTLCLIRTSPPISFGRRVELVCLATRADGSDICQDDWQWAATARWTWQGSQREGWMPTRSNDAAMARQWALYLRPDFRPSKAVRT